MLFSNTIEALPTNIIFDDTPLERVSDIKFLGVTVDNRLSWESNISYICNTISRNIAVINRLKFHIPSSSLCSSYTLLFFDTTIS